MRKIFALFLVLSLLAMPVSVLAKGPFTYLTIKGSDISGDISVTDPTMLDFFAFADFSKGSVDQPADLGNAYEVTRSFVDENKHVQNFDTLHYYPDAGYVYYDGLINGTSEYDKQWYIARPEVASDFQSVLAKNTFLTYLPSTVLILFLMVFVVIYNKRSKQKL